MSENLSPPAALVSVPVTDEQTTLLPRVLSEEVRRSEALVLRGCPTACAAMGHNQANVREIYLSVIQNTIDRAKAAFEEEDGGEDEQLTGTLDRLCEQWRTRLLENHDFSDDPTAVVGSNGQRSKSAAAKKARAEATAAGAARAQAAAAAARPQPHALPGVPTLPGAPSAMVALPGQPDALGGQIPVPGHVGGAASLAVPVVPGHAAAAGSLPGMHHVAVPPAVPEAVQSNSAKVEPAPAGAPAPEAAAAAAGSNGAAPASPTAPPPAKRARRAAEDEVVNDNEDLDSDDSDDENGSNGEDEGNAENYILAQNDRYVLSSSLVVDMAFRVAVIMVEELTWICLLCFHGPGLPSCLSWSQRQERRWERKVESAAQGRNFAYERTGLSFQQGKLRLGLVVVGGDPKCE